MTGAITTNSTFDGVDVGVRDATLTSTTTLATAAAPKASPAFTGTPTGITAAHLTGAAALPAAVTGGSGLENGITSHHKWYMNTQYYGTPEVNWGKSGAPMTQEHSFGGVMTYDSTSGLWTFPSIGYWMIIMSTNSQMLGGVSDTYTRWLHSVIFKVISGGSPASLAQAYGQIGGGGSQSNYEGETLTAFYDVTNTSTHLCKFKTQAEVTTYFWAGDNNLIFIRLGDT
jgi:hypothetical protein